MRLKQSIALLLCFMLFFSALAGCGNTETNEPVDEIPNENETEAEIIECEIPIGIDFDTAYKAFAPDTIMIKSGDIVVTWAELFVFLFRSVSSLLYTSPEDIDWSEEIDVGMTLADMVLDYSTEEAMSFMLFEYGAKVNNVVLSGDDLIPLYEELDSLIEMYGGQDEFATVLREGSGFYDFSVFERLLLIEFTMGFIMNELYGDDGADFPDEKVADYALQNNYMQAKHILINRTEEDDGSALKEIEEIHKKLLERLDDDDFFDFFDTLMNEHSEDTGGVISFPDGYLFQPNDMVLSFSMACAELDVGQISDIVESEYGYHIILRLPIDYDAVPIGIASTGYDRTLRQIAVIEDFELVLQGWQDSLNPEFTPEYQSIDLASIFPWHSH